MASLTGALLLAGPVQAGENSTLRIGYQKFNSLNILKGSGALEKALAPQGMSVSWHEFAAGPQLLEALSTGHRRGARCRCAFGVCPGGRQIRGLPGC